MDSIQDRRKSPLGGGLRFGGRSTATRNGIASKGNPNFQEPSPQTSRGCTRLTSEKTQGCKGFVQHSCARGSIKDNAKPSSTARGG